MDTRCPLVVVVHCRCSLSLSWPGSLHAHSHCYSPLVSPSVARSHRDDNQEASKAQQQERRLRRRDPPVIPSPRPHPHIWHHPSKKQPINDYTQPAPPLVVSLCSTSQHTLATSRSFHHHHHYTTMTTAVASRVSSFPMHRRSSAASATSSNAATAVAMVSGPTHTHPYARMHSSHPRLQCTPSSSTLSLSTLARPPSPDCTSVSPPKGWFAEYRQQRRESRAGAIITAGPALVNCSYDVVAVLETQHALDDYV